MKILRIGLVVEQVGPVTGAITKAMTMSRLYQCRVDFIFNSAELYAIPLSTANEIKKQYSQFLALLH